MKRDKDIIALVELLKWRQPSNGLMLIAKSHNKVCSTAIGYCLKMWPEACRRVVSTAEAFTGVIKICKQGVGKVH